MKALQSIAIDLVRTICMFSCESCVAQVFVCTIWGGLYADSPENATPKRHVLYSNDEELLLRLQAAAGSATRDQLDALHGPSLVTKYERPDGSMSFSGNDAMQSSQLPAWIHSLLEVFSHGCREVFYKCAARTYHRKFGWHLAHLKREMDNGPWKDHSMPEISLVFGAASLYQRFSATIVWQELPKGPKKDQGVLFHKSDLELFKVYLAFTF